MVTFGRKVARKSGNLLHFIHHGVSSETIELETTAKVGENADILRKIDMFFADVSRTWIKNG